MPVACQSELSCQRIHSPRITLGTETERQRAGSQGRYWRIGIAFSWSIRACYNSDMAHYQMPNHFGIQCSISIYLTHCSNIFYEDWHHSHKDFICQKICTSMSVCASLCVWERASVCKWDHLVLSKCRQDYDTVINRREEVRKVKSLRQILNV